MASCRVPVFAKDTSGIFRVASEAFAAVSAGKPYLDRHTFKCAAVAATGWKPSVADLEHILGQPVPADAELTYESLVAVVQVVLSSRDPDGHLRAIYQAFDEAGLGFIRREDALRIFKEAAPTVRSSTVEEVFDELDIGLTGRVSCDAFMSAFRTRLS